MKTAFVVLLTVAWLVSGAVRAQAPTPEATPANEDGPSAPKQVEVEPIAADEAIKERLVRILRATEWFDDPHVEVDEGVVFLSGQTAMQEYREWAGKLAQNTQGVVAVVNRIETTRRSVWDFSPAVEEARALGRGAVESLPTLGVAFTLLGLTALATWTARRVARSTLQGRLRNPLLRQLAANAVAALALILGVYLVLRISGLSRLAVTVLGGTGLFGLVVGIAFRDIAENFLASILLSVRRPFEIGDLIDVDGKLGMVQAVTTRGTLLMTFEGNHIHIPNSMVYKSVIRNYTSNPNMRLDFIVGIGYDDTIAHAQEVGMRVLREHPSVLADPEPLVLVEQLGASAVNLKFYFWVNIREHSTIKVRSAAMRMVKRAFQDAGISMPDDAREVLFPKGVPVQILSSEPPVEEEAREAPSHAPASPAQQERASSQAEGGLGSETETIEAQARQARQPIAGENLLTLEDKPNS